MDEQNSIPVKEKKTHKKSIIFIGVAFILIIALALIGGYFFINNMNENSSGAASTVADEDSPDLTAEPTRTPSSQAKYTCAENKSVEAAFFYEGDFPSAEIMLSDGTSVLLYQVESGSGARYANSDESIVFF
jgi:membrane-bound inhibitor of C-type lysozyme